MGLAHYLGGRVGARVVNEFTLFLKRARLEDQARTIARRCQPLAVEPGSDAEGKGKRHEENANRKASDKRENSCRSRSEALCCWSPACWKYSDCGDPEQQLSGRNSQDECLAVLESASEHHRCRDNTHNRREERAALPDRTGGLSTAL